MRAWVVIIAASAVIDGAAARRYLARRTYRAATRRDPGWRGGLEILVTFEKHCTNYRFTVGLAGHPQPELPASRSRGPQATLT
jgi:hypothetical protein